MLKLRGYIADHPATIMIDSGASHNFVDPAFVERAKLRLTSSDRSVKLADGTLVKALGSIRTDYTLAAARGIPIPFNSTFTATPLEGYDAILGMDWLDTHDPIIGWKDRSISIRSADGKPPRLIRPLECIEDPNHPTVARLASIGLKGFRKAHRRGEIEEVFTVIVKLSGDDSSPPREDPATEALLREFVDVFPDKLPDGLPPKRGVEHTIELKPDA